MNPFTYTALPFRVVFGAGRVAALAEELNALGAGRALLCVSPGRGAEAGRIAELADGRCAAIAARALPFTPVDCVEETKAQARDLGIDSVVSYGGGNATGLAKVVAAEFAVPFVAIPTTYSGSETTTLQAVREGGKRVQLRSPHMLPKSILYDPELTLGLPPEVAIPSGFNSVAQAVSSFFAKDTNPVSALGAEGGIRAMTAALERIAKAPGDIEARGEALYGAFLCGSTIMASGTTLQHRVCHVLAGDLNLTHAKTHTIMLPHVVAYNGPARPDAAKTIARAFGGDGDHAPGAVFDALVRCGAPTALKDIGMKEEDIGRAADLAMESTLHFSARPLDRLAIGQMIEDAYFGRRPE